MRRKALETIIGAFVLLAAIGFVVYAFNASSVGRVDGYELHAVFGRADGVSPGTEVRLSGIKVGSVLDIQLDPQTYEAIMRFNIRQTVKIPEGSSVKVLADGLLGDSYLSIEPGYGETALEPGATIYNTQDPVNIVDLLARFAFGSVEDTETNSGGGVTSGGGLE
jgi:phospholipid/cholesterol/gamma-HCH transport system substrate-binding protein